MDMADGARPVRATHPWATAGQQTIRFGTGIFGSPRTLPESYTCLFAFAGAAEALGFDSFWQSDHPTTYPDPWVTLAALAMTTKRIRLGTSVSCVYYRHPIQLARAAAEVDRLSQGRVVLGVGIGDVPGEFAQLGLPYPKTPVRQQVLAETLEIVKGLWRGEPLTYQGRHFRVENLTLAPLPIQRPHVPILIAGGGERVTLRQVARYADMSNFGAHEYVGDAKTRADVRRKLAVLDGYCAEIGRDPAAVLRSHWTSPLVLARTPAALAAKVEAIPAETRAFVGSCLVAATPQEAIEHYRSLVEDGLRYFIVATWGPDTETLELLAEHVFPELCAPGQR